MTGNYTAWNYTYWDGGSGNPCAMFACLSLASAAEVTAANAAGIRGGVGQIVVATPLTNGLPTRRIVGIATAPSNPITGEISVAIAGIFRALANAAIVAADVSNGAVIFPVAAETRTSKQTPLINNNAMLLPTPPEFTRTYQLNLVGAPAITPQAGSANVLYYPLGYALGTAGAKYDVVPIEIHTEVIYA